MSAITICEGATISAAEVKRVEEAMAKLKEDKGASHEVPVIVRLHIAHEFPKVLYKGKETMTVADSAAETEAVKDGFGSYDHQAYTAKEA